MGSTQGGCMNFINMKNVTKIQQEGATNYLRLLYKIQISKAQPPITLVNPTLETSTSLPPTRLVSSIVHSANIQVIYCANPKLSTIAELSLV
jgi:hypothetical protein